MFNANRRMKGDISILIDEVGIRSLIGLSKGSVTLKTVRVISLYWLWGIQLRITLAHTKRSKIAKIPLTSLSVLRTSILALLNAGGLYGIRSNYIIL